MNIIYIRLSVKYIELCTWKKTYLKVDEVDIKTGLKSFHFKQYKAVF